MDSRMKKLMIFTLVTLLIILLFLALFYDLRDSIFEDIRIPADVETARRFFFPALWC